MLRALSLIAVALLLAGCASTPSYRYYGERSYADGYAERVVEHAPAGYSSSWYEPGWYDYPAYYSVFWSINRWYVDPYWYPHFYYGVTWFPRNYYSVLYRSWHGPGWYGGWYGRPWHAHLAYSPYRHAWVDHYYDWYPWYANYPHYPRYYAPRYGNARNEAERLSRYSDAFRGDGLSADEMRRLSGFSRAARSQALVDARREAWRGADYTGSGARGRIDPGVSGFRQDGTRGAQPARGAGPAGVREDPQVSGFRGPDYGGRESGRALPPRSAPGSAPRQGERGIAYPYRADPQGRAPSGREAEGGVRLPSATTPAVRGGVDAPRHSGEPAVEVRTQRGTPDAPRARPYAPATSRSEPAVARGSTSAWPATESRGTPRYPAQDPASRPAPAYRAEPREAPRYEAPARSPQRYEAPVREAPRYEAPAREAPRYQAPAREAPRYEAPVREAPRVEPRSAPAPRERAEPVQRGEAQGGRRPAREED